MILTDKEKNSAGKEWLKRVNPLEGLSITQAKNVYNYSRAHGSPLLQKIYDEIEATDPVLMTCVERRQSALAGLGWRAVANASAEDQDKAEEQRRFIENAASAIDNLDEAIEHLDLAFFRGYSVVQPIWADGVRHINLLNSWNFLQGDDGRLMWNPNCTLDINTCVEITPAARCVILKRKRAIDWPALTIFIRKYLGERDWGRFIERYGIPPVDVVMAPNATDKQRDDYEECAEAAKDGRPVAWPSGASVSRAEGSRGTDPFSAFIEHQEKLIVLMATGGTLTSLAQADTGSLAGGAQMDVWTQIVQRDAVIISAALQRDLFEPLIRARFPGEPILARFELGHEDEPSSNETAELAVKLKTAGYLVDQGELEEATGLKLVKDETPAQGAFPAFNKLLNKAVEQPQPSTSTSDLLAAFAKDTNAAGKAVAELLKDPTPEAAKALLDQLPSLLPDDPDMAAVIAEAMAKEFGVMLENEGRVAANREYKRATDGKFSEIDGAPGKNPDSPETQAAEIGKGNAAIRKCMTEKVDVHNAVMRSDLGPIDFIYGDKDGGIAHIIEKHGPGIVSKLPEVLIRGNLGNPYQQGQKRNITHGAYTATIRLDRDGKNEKWVLTLFEKSKEG